MKILLYILLLFGLLQSLLELRKQSSKISKWRVKKILSALYIFGFIIGVIVTFLQINEDNQVKEVITDISSSVTKNTFIAIEQLKNIDKSIKQTQSIIEKSDSINKKMILVLKSSEYLMSQYKKVNEKLSNQLELEEKQLIERAPNIGLLDYDISLEGDDSNSYAISACIRNFGKRTALINGGSGYILFFNKTNQPIEYVEIRGNNNKGILEPNENAGMRLCFFSFAIKDYDFIMTQCDFAVICLKISYIDSPFNKENLGYYYSGWHPTEKFFGSLKDWQFNLAKKWIQENTEFYRK